jgi:Family of unknown function (DUF6084)
MSVESSPLGTGLKGAPEPEFEVTSAAHLAFAAAPTMVFSAVASEPDGHEIQSLALSVQVMIDPAKRGYDPETRARLEELFGPPARWAPSTQGLPWGQVAVVVPGFRAQTTFGIQLPCTFDLEVAATKYFYALEAGEVSLTFHFNGQVFYRGAGGALQVTPVPWSRTARFSMPVAAWRAMIDEHYPGWGWIRLQRDTLAALNAYRAEHGLPTFEACIEELMRDR